MLRPLLILMLAVCGAAGAQEESLQLQARVARIENGLREPVAVQGQSARTMRLADRMRNWRVPGVSIAVINHGAIEWARGYGVTDAGGSQPVTPDTPFQVGSVSKPVAAVLALQLTAAGKVNLDEDVNQRLHTWKVPATTRPVTMRALLSHTAGMPEFNLPGYGVDEAIPTLLQVLNGEKPAINPPVTPNGATGYAYSSLGYAALQQTLADLNGQPFEALAGTMTLAPLGMRDSAFAASLPTALAARAAAGHDVDGAVLPGRWRRHVELAADGLWSTAPDLARFAIAIQRAAAGTSPGWLPQAQARAMLTPVRDDYGLGFELDHAGREPAFHHSGSNIGYKALLFAYTRTGQGAVVLTNGDGGWPLLEEIMRSIAAEYGWEDFLPIVRKTAPAKTALFDSYVGQYRVSNTTLRVSRDGDRLLVAGPPLGPQPLEAVPAGDQDFFFREKDATLHFDANGGQPVQTLTFLDGRPRPGKRLP